MVQTFVTAMKAPKEQASKDVKAQRQKQQT